MAADILVFYVPASSPESAEVLGREAVEAGLAACANVFPVRSAYLWNDALQDEAEVVVVLKTFPEKETALEAYLMAHHPYDLPALVRWPARVNDTYADWMRSVIR
jgi:periplasmic divalent cation tolerance protein